MYCISLFPPYIEDYKRFKQVCSLWNYYIYNNEKN